MVDNRRQPPNMANNRRGPHPNQIAPIPNMDIFHSLAGIPARNDQATKHDLDTLTTKVDDLGERLNNLAITTQKDVKAVKDENTKANTRAERHVDDQVSKVHEVLNHRDKTLAGFRTRLDQLEESDRQTKESLRGLEEGVGQQINAYRQADRTEISRLQGELKKAVDINFKLRKRLDEAHSQLAASIFQLNQATSKGSNLAELTTNHKKEMKDLKETAERKVNKFMQNVEVFKEHVEVKLIVLEAIKANLEAINAHLGLVGSEDDLFGDQK